MKAPFQTQQGRTRQPAVAGAFYPGDRAKLADMVDSYLALAETHADSAPKALIAPHAGYIYSGPIAGSAFVHWRVPRDVIRRVILLGPSHFVPFSGLALSGASAWATPLGDVPVDQEATEQARALPQVRVLDEAHEQEHSLEVELAFLQRVLSDFRILPLVIGEVSPEEVCELMVKLWGGPETAFVISSDLSHYHDYATATRLDRETANAIETLQPDKIQRDDACGRIGIQGLLHAARRFQLGVKTVDLRNSGDTAGRKDRVVGYGAFTFCAPTG